MRMPVLLLVLILVSVPAFNCFATGQKTPAEYLAISDKIHPELRENKVKINRYNTLVDSISRRLEIDQKDILGQCYKCKTMLEEKGIAETNLNILEAVFKVSILEPRKQFSGYLVDYLILRTEAGQSHEESIKFMTSPAYDLFRFKSE